MEKLLLADVKVNEDAMQALALQRGVAVKEYLASKELPLNRLFLGATRFGKAAGADAKPDAKSDGKTDAKTGGSADAKPGTKWTPSAELNIAMP